MDKPEQHAIDEIDELIAAGLDDDGNPLDDYNADRYVKCELCQGDWHGTPSGSCPGAWSTDEQKQEYATQSSKSVGSTHLSVIPDGHGGGPINRMAARFTDMQGNIIDGTIIFVVGGNASAAVYFCPGPPSDDDGHRYQYITPDSGSEEYGRALQAQISQHAQGGRGFTSDFLQYDEAHSLNPPVPQVNSDGVCLIDP